MHYLFLVLLALFLAYETLAFAPVFRQPSRSLSFVRRHAFVIKFDDDNNDDDDNDDEEEDDDEEEEEPDPYAEKAASEFLTDSSGLAPPGTTSMDWGGALGTLRERVSDVESGDSQKPSNALFRLMTSQTPNQAIGNFVTSANPQVVQAMSGAVNALLGGLSNPAMGVETVVRASEEKVAGLCFQLQMTGYMFRNAEYVVALKDIMNLKDSTSDYKEAFERLDTDGSGFIETAEIESLLRDVYEDKPPAFEVRAFMEFFDANGDGKISWSEFEQGLGDMSEQRAAKAVAAGALLPALEEDDDDDEEHVRVEPHVTGIIELELQDGKIKEVEAKEYMDSLKKEAEELKAALKRERSGATGGMDPMSSSVMPANEMAGGITEYIASRSGDLKSLTEGISPDVVDTMKQLVDFVLAGGSSSKKEDADKDQREMELPGAALQQLALWQLVLGYRLREAEATGEYLRLLDN